MRILFVFAAAFIGTACGRADSAQQRVPTSGEYEVTTSFVSLRAPGLTERQQAEVREASGLPSVERRCLNPSRPVVGATGPIESCTYSRIGDSSTMIDRESVCAAPDRSEPGGTLSMRGNVAATGYDFTITFSDGAGLVAVTREVGRRLGECRPDR